MKDYSKVIYALVERVYNWENTGSFEDNVVGVSEDRDTLRNLLKEFSDTRIGKLLEDYDKSEIETETHNPDFHIIIETNNDYRWEYEIQPTLLYEK